MAKFLITGLGNPGSEYENTRHNIGFQLLDAMAEKLGASFESCRYGWIAKARYRGRILLLLKPATFMNLSGNAVRYWLNKEKIELPQSMVILDDLALPVGMLRMKKKGSDAGHNGLSHIIQLMNTNQFPRLRFGIGNDFPRGAQVNFVLGKWTYEEEKIVRSSFEPAIQACLSFVMEGIDRAMNKYNNHKPKTDEKEEK